MKTVIVLRVSVVHSPLHRASVAAAVAMTLAITGCSTSQTKTSEPSGAGHRPAGTGSTAAATCPTAPVAVVVSVDQWGDIVSELGGACANVKTVLASSSVDPHEYEPSPADAASFMGAKLSWSTAPTTTRGHPSWRLALLAAPMW